MSPERTFQCGLCRASIFLNEMTTEDGISKKSYSVNVHRRFQDKETNSWKSVSTYRLSELPQVALLLELAMEYVAAREANGDPGQKAQ